MAGSSRNQRRLQGGEFYRLFAAGSATGVIVRLVTGQLARQRVAEGKWREVYWADDETFAGYQPMDTEQIALAQKISEERKQARKSYGQGAAIAQPMLSPEATITLAETRRVAGEFGPSRTMGMPEWKRDLREGRRIDTGRRIVTLHAEDSIERAIEKVKQWPYPASVLRDAKGAARSDDKGRPIFGDKAVRVYPPAPKRGGR